MDKRYSFEHSDHPEILKRLKNLSSVDVDGCHIWHGQTRGDNYGGIRIRGTVLLAHRVSFVLHFGSLDVDEVVRHKCHNRKCINPQHLERGSVADNNNDRIEAGRSRVNPQAISETKKRLYSYQFLNPATNEIFESHVEFAQANNKDPRTVAKALEQGLPINGQKFEVLRRPIVSGKKRSQKIDFSTPSLLRQKLTRLADINLEGCLIWAASTNHSGYGQLHIDGQYWPAHKVSYILHNGALEDGLVVRHTCHNKRCINPEHLVSGTHKENAQDNIEAGNLIQNSSKQSASRSRNYGLKILNIKTGEIVFGMKRLARQLDINPKRLRRMINNNTGEIGKAYQIVGAPDLKVPVELTTKSGEFNPNAIAVVCVDTGEKFPTLTAASDMIGLGVSALSQAIRDKTKCGGKHWTIDEPGALENFVPKPNQRFQRVKRLDTGQIYGSINEAAADIKRKPGNLARVLDKPGSKCGGVEWCRVDE